MRKEIEVSILDDTLDGMCDFSAVLVVNSQVLGTSLGGFIAVARLLAVSHHLLKDRRPEDSGEANLTRREMRGRGDETAVW